MNKERLIEEEETKQTDSPNDALGIYKSFLATPKVKNIVRKFGLFVVVILYTSLGASVFQWIEYDEDIIHIDRIKHNLLDGRLNFIQQIEKEKYYTDEIEQALQIYEKHVETSLKEGVSPSLLNSSLITQPRWSFTQSIFFASTVLTTIGYGNIAPGTHLGRVFCIAFALIGIPLTLSMIADMGELLAKMLPLQTMKKLLPKGRWRTIISIFATFGLLLSFNAFGGLLFWWLENWSFLDAFYFCFITTTTIGFGDLVPTPSSLLVCGIYILIGLALTSMVIEIVRMQYAESFDKLKMLSMKIQMLSAPLAEAMKKMAETGSGEIDVDSNLVKELQELNCVLTEVQNLNSSEVVHEDPWQALLDITQKKKRITVIMYESSV